MIYSKQCPKCGKEMFYKRKTDLSTSIKYNKQCRQCAYANRNYEKVRTDEYRKLRSEQSKGKNNPMYGKTVYEVWVEKYGKEEAEKRRLSQQLKNKNRTTSDITRKKISVHSAGKNNPMYGKTVYEVWVEKYGKEEADRKLILLKAKCSQNSKGENNPMYGKPSPQGSGNGWSGWYKKYYFRSLLELSYLKYLLDNNIKFESGEKNIYKIKYFDSHSQTQRNYFPDFYLIDTQEYIELKPKKLCGSKNNIDKFSEAKKQLGDKFIILTEEDIGKLSFETIQELRSYGDLKFLDRYEQKFLQRININENHNM